MIDVCHINNIYGNDLFRLMDDWIRYRIPFDWKWFFIKLMICARNMVFRRRFDTFPYPCSAPFPLKPQIAQFMKS